MAARARVQVRAIPVGVWSRARWAGTAGAARVLGAAAGVAAAVVPAVRVATVVAAAVVLVDVVIQCVVSWDRWVVQWAEGNMGLSEACYWEYAKGGRRRSSEGALREGTQMVEGQPAEMLQQMNLVLRA